MKSEKKLDLKKYEIVKLKNQSLIKGGAGTNAPSTGRPPNCDGNPGTG